MTQHPLIIFPTVTRTHHKDPDLAGEWGRTAHGIALALQPVVEPFLAPGPLILDRSLITEVHLPMHTLGLLPMDPRPHHEVHRTLQRP